MPLRQRAVSVLQRLVDVREEEVRALTWAFLYFFTLLCGYYVIRPLRDEMGIAGGVDQLQWLFTGTFLAMLAAVPVYAAVVARYPRHVFVPWVYRFFILNLLVFWGLLQWGASREVVARVFFIWTSLFNLFVVSVFWSFLADLFRNEQGRRLFGFIAAGGSAGAMLGPALTAALVEPIGTDHLLLISAVLLQGSVLCVQRLVRWARTAAPDGPTDGPAPAGGGRDDGGRIGGGILTGVRLVLRSPYLLGISLFILLYTVTSTFLYFEQAHIVEQAAEGAEARTSIFASIDLLVNVLTLGIQMTLTGRVIRYFGVAATLALVPALTAAGFVGLGLAPGLWMLVGFQGVRRATNYALSRPAREILFTVVGREEKYKSKNFIDTVVYRGGDAVSGWVFAGLGALGFGLSAIAFMAAPVALVWLGTGWLLGRQQEALRERAEAAPESPSAA